MGQTQAMLKERLNTYRQIRTVFLAPVYKILDILGSLQIFIHLSSHVFL